MRKVAILLLVVSFILSLSFQLLAEETASQVQKTVIEIDKEKALREKIEKERAKPVIEELPALEEAPAVPGESKVMIKDITVIGVTLLTQEEINKITSPYKNKELAVREMQKVADLITDAYRKKGYITSRAYLPPQKLETGLLEIRVMEGITGEILVKDNRYFKSALYRNKISLKNGQPFNYESLRKGLSNINQLPDRSVKAVLIPGKAPGTTDVVLEVKERLPIHIGFDYDNYGSRYIGKNRYRTTLTHNNLLGFDDTLTFQYQLAEADSYSLLNLRYLLPLTESLKLGVFAADSKLDLQRELKASNARGKSRLYSLFLTQALINKENVSLDFNLGFDYKDSFNFQNNLETSRDRMRIAKSSLDLDLTDTLGRTIINNEVSFGLPNIMGGLKDVDLAHSSRSGAGGEFFKDNLDILRLQKLPFSATLLWKNQLQFTSDILTSTEQFQIGGIINVRGYPPAEVVGDSGYSSTFELSMPPYFISKDLKVPFSKAKIYDALRLVTFYDWANAHLKRPAPTEEKSKTLRAAGFGMRLYLPEDFSLRVELAWPLDNKPSDGDNMHAWTEVSKSF